MPRLNGSSTHGDAGGARELGGLVARAVGHDEHVEVGPQRHELRERSRQRVLFVERGDDDQRRGAVRHAERLPFRVPRSWGPVRWFVCVASVFGIAVRDPCPSVRGYDEPLHFLRAWQVGDGRLVSVDDRSSTAALATDRDELGGRFPDELRTDIIDLIEDGRVLDRRVLLRSVSHLNDRAPRGERPVHRVPVGGGVLADPLPSERDRDRHRAAPSTSRRLRRFLLARLAGLGAYIGLVALAIRRLPQRKWVLATLGLAPIVIFQAATVTADTVTVALAVLLLAEALRLASLRRGTVPTGLRRRDRHRHGRASRCANSRTSSWRRSCCSRSWRHRERVADRAARRGVVVAVDHGRALECVGAGPLHRADAGHHQPGFVRVPRRRRRRSSSISCARTRSTSCRQSGAPSVITASPTRATRWVRRRLEHPLAPRPRDLRGGDHCVLDRRTPSRHGPRDMCDRARSRRGHVLSRCSCSSYARMERRAWRRGRRRVPGAVPCTR